MNAPSRRADLHTHTSCSDGQLTPTALVRKADERGLSALAITDHDTIGGLEEGQAAGARCGVEVIAGGELSVTVGEEELHLLGYFFDPTHPDLQQALERMQAGRRQRARDIVERLRALDVPLSFEAVQEQAQGGAIGRPHVAAALVAAGHVSSSQEAFRRYLHDDGPAFVAKPQFPAAEALDLLHAAGGIGVLAHPGQWTSEETVRQLVRDGLDGLEIHHPSHTAWLRDYYQQMAQRFDLIETGGSDYHGHRPQDDDNFGRYGIPVEQLDRLRRTVV